MLSRWTDILLPLAAALLFAGCNSQPVRETPPSGPAAQVAPTVDAAAELRHATLALQDNSPARARDILLSLTRTAPDDAIVWLNLGIAQLRLDEVDDAIISLERSTELAPQSPAAFNLLGVAYRRAGHVDSARDAYDRSLALDADYALAHYNLAVLYDIYLQEPNRALLHYRRYERLTPDTNPDVRSWITQLESHHVN